MDYIMETPNLARSYCPGCEPNADPMKEILDLRHCDTHMPSRDGALDDSVGPPIYLSSANEVGGPDNARWCEMLHRKKKPKGGSK